MASFPRVSLVTISSAALQGYMLHAFTTANEEVMGLILGNWVDLPTSTVAGSTDMDSASASSECIADVAGFLVQRRLDKRPDRVELAPEQLIQATAEAEQWSTNLGRRIRVIGWYHSHPNITVLPSHVDVGTQKTQQLLDARFFGLIMSVFHAESDHTQQQKLIAFQTDPATSTARILPISFYPSPMDPLTRCMVASVPRTIHAELVDEYNRVASPVGVGTGANAPAGRTLSGLHHVTEQVELLDKILEPAVTVAAHHRRGCMQIGWASEIDRMAGRGSDVSKGVTQSGAVVDDLIQF